MVPLPKDMCADKKGPACDCDLSGTFLVQTASQVHWDQVLVAGQVAIAGGKASLKSWGVWTLTQSGGAITARARGCGGEVPEICGPLLMETYSEAIPDTAWDNPSLPREAWQFTLDTTSLPAKLVGGPHAAFLGLRLKDGLDPLGAFPTSGTDPNLVWADDDGDMEPGVTSVVHAAGGISAQCGYAFALVPVEQVALNPARASKVRGGVRSVQNISINVDSCDVLHGSVTTQSYNGRVQGCTLGDGSTCTTAEVQYLDSQPQTQKIDAINFVLQRAVSEPASCADVRSAVFPP
jgi:hypothetical protein